MRLLSFLGLVAAVARAASPPLSISLETSWPAPSILLEILYIPFDPYFAYD